MTRFDDSKNIRLLALGLLAQMQYQTNAFGFDIKLFSPSTVIEKFVMLETPGVPRSYGSVEEPTTIVRVELERFVHMVDHEPWSIYMGYDKPSNTLCIAKPDWW